MHPFNTTPVAFFSNQAQSKIVLDKNGNELKSTKQNLSFILIIATLLTITTLSYAGSSEPRLAGGNGGATGRSGGK
ncbi:MAG: hypothetical protein U0T83_10515 [Bacteriovoracaceae bacterium]